MSWTRLSARSSPRHQQGFTAVEALVALLILLLGAALLAVGFHRWVVHARAGEAAAMLSEIASKEQAYRAGGGQYLPLRADGHGGLPSRDEAPAAFYPLPA